MITNVDTIKKLKAIKPYLADRFHVKRLGYFGSYATEQQTELSDIDILVEFNRPVGWEFFTLEKYLEASLGLKVDLVTHNALKEKIKETVLKQIKYI